MSFPFRDLKSLGKTGTDMRGSTVVVVVVVVVVVDVGGDLSSVSDIWVCPWVKGSHLLPEELMIVLSIL